MPMKIRPIRIEGQVAYVPLTKGYEAVIDATDAPLVEGWNWRAMVKKHTVYAVRGEWLGQGEWRTISIHRVILNPPDGLLVDHRDGNGLLNQRFNLRGATPSQNGCNQRLHGEFGRTI